MSLEIITDLKVYNSLNEISTSSVNKVYIRNKGISPVTLVKLTLDTTDVKFLCGLDNTDISYQVLYPFLKIDAGAYRELYIKATDQDEDNIKSKSVLNTIMEYI